MQAANVPTELWELAKGVMLSLVTLGTGYLVRSVRKMEFHVRELQIDVRGIDGTNGLKGTQKEHNQRLEKIEERNERIDAVTEYEKQHYTGPERRQAHRRLRDKEFPNPLDVEDN